MSTLIMLSVFHLIFRFITGVTFPWGGLLPCLLGHPPGIADWIAVTIATLASVKLLGFRKPNHSAGAASDRQAKKRIAHRTNRCRLTRHGRFKWTRLFRKGRSS